MKATVLFISALLMGSVLLSACGVKGPLYAPPAPSSNATEK